MLHQNFSILKLVFNALVWVLEIEEYTLSHVYESSAELHKYFFLLTSQGHKNNTLHKVIRNIGNKKKYIQTIFIHQNKFA